MMHKTNLFLVTLFTLVSSVPIFAQEQKSFWQKHKGKIITGTAIGLGAAAVAGSVYYTQQARDTGSKAGIATDDPLYTEAVIAVGLVGPLGKDKFLNICNQAVEKGIITREQYYTVLSSSIGKALAKKWGITQTSLVFAAGFKDIKRTTTAAAKQAWNDFKSIFE
jgi:hypothetical protein